MAIDALFSVDRKVVLITGGTSGIGLMIARAFVARGARTYIVARTAQRCSEVETELAKSGTCVSLPGDVSTLRGIESIVQAFAARENELDILINNAGIVKEADVAELDEAGWDAVVDVNLKGPFFLTQGLLPLIRRAASRNGRASIINIGSAKGIRAGAKQTYSYDASKAGLHHLTHSLAKRLGPDHITVNALAPGHFPSEMTRGVFGSSAPPSVVREIPLGLLGEPDDIAGACIFLASRAGGFVNGAVIPVDGGKGV